MAAHRDHRRIQIGRIKAAQKGLGLDDTTYRALLQRVTGKGSCADMTTAERNAVIAEFVRLGFKDQRKDAARRRWPGEPKNCDAVPMLRKVRALLTDAKRPWSYAHALAKQMHGVARVEWLDDDKLHRLVAALQIDANRRQG